MESLYTWLTADPRVLALAADRVYPRKRTPQGQRFPQLTFFRVDHPRVKCLDGPCGLASPRVQLDCWARSQAEAARLAQAVRLCLDGFRGPMAGTFVQGASVEDERDGGEDPVHAEETGVANVSLDVVIWHDEATT